MKRLINPPIQNLLWLGGIACLGFAVWSVWQLRQAEEHQFATAGGVSVDIPNASELSIPGVRQYRKLVEAPLFWEARARPKKAPPPPRQVAAVKELEVVEAELTLPLGRLVGIVDLGKEKYALVRSEAESQSLHKGDAWEGWTVEDINSERVVISAGKQRHEVELIGDFEAPAANKQMLASRQRQQQRKKHRQQQLRQAQQKQQAQHYDRAKKQPQHGDATAQAVPQVNPALNQQNQNNATRNNQGQQAEPAPVLSIKEALEARQRLMASRWGKEKKK